MEIASRKEARESIQNKDFFVNVSLRVVLAEDLILINPFTGGGAISESRE